MPAVATLTLIRAGMTEKEVKLWAGQYPLRHTALALTLADLGLPHRTADGYVHAQTTVDAILSRHSAPGTRMTTSAAIIERCLDLCRLAEHPEAQIALEEQQILAQDPLADSDLEAFRQRLLRLRAQVRPFAKPRPSQLTRVGFNRLDIETRRVHLYDADARRFCPDHYSAYLTLGFDGEDATSHEGSMRCAGQCPLVTTAIDWLIEWLTNAKLPKDFLQLAHNLAVPPWQLALDRLDAVLQQQAKVIAKEQRDTLGWRVGISHRLWDIEPVWLTTDRKGATRLKKATLKELRQNPTLCQTPADARAAELLRPDAHHPTALWSMPEPERMVSKVIQALVGHPYVFAMGSDEPLTVREVAFQLTLQPHLAGGRWRVELDGELLTPAQALDRQQGARAECLVMRKGAEVQVTPLTAAQLGVLQALAVDDDVPADAFEPLLQRLPQLSHLMPVQVPTGLRGRQVPASVRPVLQVDALPDGSLTLWPKVRPLPGGALHPPGSGQAEVYMQCDGERLWTRRDLDAEVQAVGLVWTLLGIEREDVPTEMLQLVGDDALDMVGQLAVHEAEVEVQWARRKRVVTTKGENLRVQVADRPDWFGISGGLEVEGTQVDLSAVLEAVRQRRGYVQVTGELWLRLSDTLRTRLEKAADAVVQTRDGLALSPLQADALGDLVTAEMGQKWRNSLAKIRHAGETQHALPLGLNAELRPYQLEGFHWLARLAEWSTGAVLADDMGLGKTLQALALLLHRQALGPALVVAPTSVEFNWLREAQNFAPELKISAWRHGDRKQATTLAAGDVLVISYDLLVRDAARLNAVKWATLVCDEAQAVKNSTTQRWKAVTKLEADFRVGLTGTPVENHIGELWAVFTAMVPGLLGPWALFLERFGTAIERDGSAPARKALGRILRPFLLRRMKTAVAKDLPPRTEIRVDIEPSDAERQLYEQVRLASLKEIQDQEAPPNQRRFQVLAAITRLRQVACHARLFDPASQVPSAKLERLLELLAELRSEGHRALVFSQFVQHLTLVRERLEAASVAYRYLDGSTPEQARRREVDAFQRGEGDVFLISLKAGGTGLNLTAADYVLHLDPWWNPAVEDQATDRAHRIGQDKPVTVYRLVTRGTIEERILELHDKKRDLVASLLDGTADAGKLSTEELLGMLGEAAGESPLARLKVAQRKR